MSARFAPLSALFAAALAAVLAITLLGAPEAPTDDPVDLAATSTNRPTPATHFKGYGFDQCLAPTQAKMDTWMESSPFLAVGIYISGASRACRSQPNLTATWVTRQLARGWQLLPITLGPQASCSTRYPRYGAAVDPKISANNANGYATARNQGRIEADRAVLASRALGITQGSTLFYDLEAFDITNATCKASAIRFLDSWTVRLHALGYKSGYYSSAGSGIKMVNDFKAKYPTTFTYPDTLWIARWDGAANTSVSSSYLAPTAWTPGRRIKQYQGGHNETWGGVTINIDRNFLELGAGMVPGREVHCGGVPVDLASYTTLKMPTATYKPPVAAVKAMQCLMAEVKAYTGKINGVYDLTTRRAVYTWQRRRGFAASSTWGNRDWITLLTAGARPVLKYGSAGLYVRRVQRAMRVAMPSRNVQITGVYDATMATHAGYYRRQVGVSSYNIINTATWLKLQSGRY